MRYLIALCLFVGACQSLPGPMLEESRRAVQESTKDALPHLKLGEHQLKVELACSTEEQQRGLMFRQALPEDQGMLFIFAREQELAFWMRNTLIPLSVAYIDRDGVIIEIHTLEPLNETPVASSQPAQYALEVNQGWFQAHKIEPGLRIQLDSFCADPTP